MSYIASGVGKPLHADSPTENQKRVSYVGVCVEVTANKQLPKRFNLEIGNNQFIAIDVDYQWKPTLCLFCEVFGHEEDCSFKIEQHGKGSFPPYAENFSPTSHSPAGMNHEDCAANRPKNCGNS